MRGYIYSFLVQVEVRDILDSIITDIVEWDAVNTKAELHRLVSQTTARLHVELRHKLLLETANRELMQQRDAEKLRAKTLRIRFQRDLALFRDEMASKARLEKHFNSMKEDLDANVKLVKELTIHQQHPMHHNMRPHATLHNTSGPPILAPAGCDRTPFRVLSDRLLLKLSAFLSAPDTLSMAQVCPQMCHRLDMLFSSQMQNPGHPKVKSQLKSQVTSNCDSGSQEIRVVNNMQWLTADAIVKKLSKDEMKGLLAITAKMKRVEMDQAALQAEKEDLFARLQSVESVRDFLLEKVKETETALSASAEEVAQAAAQAASDHEVIGFLDSRAKELEKMKQDQEDSNRHLRTEIRVLQEQLQAVQDELILVRADKEEKEVQFRSQKKLLVKEIKVLRAHQHRSGDS